jgi:hypothetical protein
MYVARAYLGPLQWLAPGSLQTIGRPHIGPRTHVTNGNPHSDGQDMFPNLYVHFIENYVIQNPSSTLIAKHRRYPILACMR